MGHIIDDYIINFLTRQDSPEDAQKLKEWLAADPAHRNELKQWLAMWDAVGMTNAGKLSPEEAYHRFMFRLQQDDMVKTPKGKFTMKIVSSTIYRIAVVFLISFSLGVVSHYLWIKREPTQVVFTENIVPLGSKSEIKLPDGSIVWLNAGSTLRYSTDYGRITRDVYLSGEGYFKVAKQTKKPFTVHTPLMKIQAVGTEFNVKAYPEEGNTETTLVNGIVYIEKVDENVRIDTPIILKPGQKFSVRTVSDTRIDETEQTQVEHIKHEEPQLQPIVEQLTSATISAEVSWKESNWRIESETLQELAIKLERRYDVHIRIDEQLKNYRFTGTIKDESLEQVLHAMQLTAPILFKVEGKMVFIYIDQKKMK